MQGARRGLNPRSPGSGPGLKVALNRWATQTAQLPHFLTFNNLLHLSHSRHLLSMCYFFPNHYARHSYLWSQSCLLIYLSTITKIWGLWFLLDPHCTGVFMLHFQFIKAFCLSLSLSCSFLYISNILKNSQSSPLPAPLPFPSLPFLLYSA